MLCDGEQHIVESIDIKSEDNYKKITFGWVFSLALHGIISLLLMSVYLISVIETERPPVKMPIILPPEEIEEIEPIEKVDIVPVEVVIETTEISNNPQSEIDLQIDEESITEDDVITDNPESKGREDAISEMEAGGTFAFMNIGAGAGSSGAFGRNIGGDRRRINKEYGPHGQRAHSAIDRALMWLKRHQSPDGGWDSDEYWTNCVDTIKCEPGRNVNGADEALTGYAVLCFLGAGYDHKTPHKYRKTVNDGIQWLLANQKNGLFGSRNYEHAIATMAICEAYAMTMDPSLKTRCQDAINIILERQCKIDGYPLAWDYISPKLERCDISVSGWNIMGLKAATAGGIDVGNGLVGASNWLKLTWQSANKNYDRITQYDTSVFPYTYNAVTKETSREHLSFVGTLCGVFLKHNDDVMILSMMNDVDKRWFDNDKYKENSYALYYASLSSFMLNTDSWKNKWNNKQNGYIPWLLNTMITTGNCHDGTWKHNNETWHGADTSPVLLHVYKTLAMEVAIRYERM